MIKNWETKTTQSQYLGTKSAIKFWWSLRLEVHLKFNCNELIGIRQLRCTIYLKFTSLVHILTWRKNSLICTTTISLSCASLSAESTYPKKGENKNFVTWKSGSFYMEDWFATLPHRIRGQLRVHFD